MQYNPTNVFAKIMRGEIPCTKVYEDEHTLAFRDVQPAAPLHVLVIPKGKFTSFNDFVVGDATRVGSFFQTVQKIAAQEGLVEGGYRLITNHGADASQSVAHFHVHILGGKQLGALLSK